MVMKKTFDERPNQFYKLINLEILNGATEEIEVGGFVSKWL